MNSLKKEIDKKYAKLAEELTKTKLELKINTTEELLELAIRRAKIYLLLSKGYFVPTIDLVRKIISGEIYTLLKDSTEYISNKIERVPLIEEGISEMYDFCNRHKSQDAEKLLKLLQEDYALIFYDISFPIVSPYESIYKSEKQLMADSTFKVIEKYKQTGLFVNNFRDIEDHVTLELEFMYHLCKEEIKNWKNAEKDNVIETLKKEKEFLLQHLIWMIFLAEDTIKTVKKKETVGFYSGIAKVLKGFISSEISYIESFLEIAQKVEPKITETYKFDVQENLFLMPIE